LKFRLFFALEVLQMADRTYRDPVLGSIAFDWEKEAFVIELIDTPEFQRLRRIRQLGAASLVFQGAEHSRFTHSVGVAFLAKRMYSKLILDERFPKDLDEEGTRKAVLAAALLHDVGHGPFSHLFERVFAHKNHEQWGFDIVQDSQTQVNAVLDKHGLVDSVKKIFQRQFRPRLAQDIISSQLDADRLDYLLRDSHMTGVTYGRYDLDWLLEVIELAQIPTGKEDLGLAINLKKGWHAAEQFVIGRYLMYQQVYYHKTIRSAERMIKLIFERLAEMAEGDRYPDPCPEPLRRLLEPDQKRMNLASYLRLDDEFVLTCFRLWSDREKEDDVLRSLCGRLTRRELFKTAVFDSEKTSDALRFSEAMEALKKAAHSAGFDPRYFLAVDTAEDFPYKDMMWFVAKQRSPEDIWLAENGRANQPLSDPNISPLIDSLRNTSITTHRLCFPKELKDVVREHLQPYLSDHVGNGSTNKRRQPTLLSDVAELARER
jgi:uncharacterized protein